MHSVRVNRALKTMKRLIPFIGQWLRKRRFSRLEKIVDCVETALAQSMLHTLVTRWREAIVCLQRGIRKFLLRLAASNREIVETWDKKDKKRRFSQPLKYLMVETYRRYLRKAARKQAAVLSSSFQSHASVQLLKRKTAIEIIDSKLDAPKVGSFLITRQNFFKFSAHQIDEMTEKCKKWAEGADLDELPEEEAEEIRREIGRDERNRSASESGKYGRGRKPRRPKHIPRNCT